MERLWSQLAPRRQADEIAAGSTRRELLDHVLLVDDQHLAFLLRQYQRYFDERRPHQGLGQRVPVPPAIAADPTKPIVVTSVLGGLHVDYRRAA